MPPHTFRKAETGFLAGRTRSPCSRTYRGDGRGVLKVQNLAQLRVVRSINDASRQRFLVFEPPDSNQNASLSSSTIMATLPNNVRRKRNLPVSDISAPFSKLAHNRRC
jgi:hypothetical protein